MQHKDAKAQRYEGLCLRFFAPLRLCVLFLIFGGLFGWEYRHNVAVCAIFQDEAPYLKEWIEYHRLVGVEHFILHNHQSSDNYKEILQPYIQAGVVELKELSEPALEIGAFNKLQCRAYNETVERCKGQIKWIAFIDIDEFLVPIQKRNLLDVLKDYEEVGGLAVNWRIFGTSSLKCIPEGKLLIESLTRCTKAGYTLNRHIKTILRPERASHFINPHDALYKEGFFQVNTDKMPFENRFCPYVRSNKLRINHYWTRAEDYFFSKKIPRQKRWGGSPNPEILLQEMNEEEDAEILRFVPALRKRLHD